MRPKIHKHVLCANNFLTILRNIKQWVVLPSSDFTGGGGGGAKQPSVKKRYWCAKHAYIVLDFIAI